ncbi:paraquat-inducible protein A [Dyella marensis]|uniref:Paraquat-inducible protein A n=1 Tax=Dyella marensis TaxID=500610 RepID=A0A1I2C4D0_9GAMM|nr:MULTISPECIES: paraquat-inducible protein A [Dyella]SFE63187.1 paraquat-inducible protein A [Dyella marensis]
MTVRPRAQHLGMVGCRVCGLVVSAPLQSDQRSFCPRCRSELQPRLAGGSARAWAFWLAALIFYVPANLLPVMDIRVLGGAQHAATILGGVVDLWRDGSHGVALVVFVASVLIPTVKYLALVFLLLTVRHANGWARRARARLYRWLEAVGYWSMLDVVVVGLLVSLVQFQALGEIQPRAGILFFGMSVVLTMLATQSFDARLIWDGEGDDTV